MRRRLLPTLLALSLLLDVANLALWAVSYRWVCEAGLEHNSWPHPQVHRTREGSIRMVEGRWGVMWDVDELDFVNDPPHIGYGFRFELEAFRRGLPVGIQPGLSVEAVDHTLIGRTTRSADLQLGGQSAFGFGTAYWGYNGFIFPAWLPALLFLAPPLIYFSPRLRRRRRRRAGLCPACGYDLRGSPPNQSLCPECGHTASPRSIPLPLRPRRFTRRDGVAARIVPPPPPAPPPPPSPARGC